MSTELQTAPTARYTTVQRRMLTAAAGLGVAILAGAAFVLTYDDLRALAIEGRAAERWAPAYPIMVDGLIAITVLSLVVARHARWWTRLSRWALLLALVGGCGAASVQRALNGYGAISDDHLNAGVATAPHVLLIVAVWLWLTMFKHVRPALADTPEVSPTVPLADRERAHDEHAEPEARDEYDEHVEHDLIPGMARPRAAHHDVLADAPEAQFTPLPPPLLTPLPPAKFTASPPALFTSLSPEGHRQDTPPQPPKEDDAAGEEAEPLHHWESADHLDELMVDDDPTPPAGAPMVSADVEFVGGPPYDRALADRPASEPPGAGRPAPLGDPAAATPDPSSDVTAVAVAVKDGGDDDEAARPPAEGGTAADEISAPPSPEPVEPRLPPPSSNLRSSPTPPED